MKITFSVMAAALAALAVMLVSLYFTGSGGVSDKPPEQPPEYHVQLVTQSGSEHFWTMFKKGAQSAAADCNMYVEFVDIAQRDADLSVQAVEQAIYASVDGIALQAADLARTEAVLDAAIMAELAVLTFENDVFFAKNAATVGSNSYDIGYEAGRMGAAACGGRAKVAVLVDDVSADESGTSPYKNLKLQGMLEAFAGYDSMELTGVYTLSTGMFDVEKVTSRILEEHPDVSLVICTQEKSTPGVAQMVVDANRVGDIRVVGFGAMPQTLEYIERGVIYGTICPDAYEIGYTTVAQLCERLHGRQISDLINTGIYAVTAQNLDEYELTLSTQE
ncbi:MAG: sugar ABC transporter substrate-binding protein [Acetanaerobacterium sp.]